MSNLEKVKVKIAALIAKAKNSGSSEAEAIAAMDIARKIMAEHGVTLADIERSTGESKSFNKVRANPGQRNLHTVDQFLVSAIATYTDTKVWIDKNVNRDSAVMFFGYSIDVELAVYLRDICLAAMDREWKLYSAKLPAGNRASKRKSFMAGMALRLRERLQAMKQDMSSSNAQQTGTDLVVVKTHEVAKAFSDMNLRLKKGGMVRVNANSAFSDGKLAGDKVGLGRPVSGYGSVKMIGR